MEKENRKKSQVCIKKQRKFFIGVRCASLSVLIMLSVSLSGCSQIENGQAESGTKAVVMQSESSLVEDNKAGKGEESDQVAERKETETAAEQDFPKMDDIEWSFTNSVRYEEPVALFGYINHSDFTIVRLDVSFEMKKGITAEQMQVFIPLKEKTELTDDDIIAFRPEIYDYMVCDPDEKVDGATCYLSYNLEPTDAKQCELLDLHYAEISYIGVDEKIHKVSYSAENGGYKVTDLVEEPYAWSDSEYACMVPKPDTRIVTVDYDKADYYQCTAYDMDGENFKIYIDKCKEAGFSNDIEESDYSFWGKNAQGYQLHARYLEHMQAVEVTLEKK